MADAAKRSWRRATLTAVLLSVLFVAVALVSLKEAALRIERVQVPEEVERCAADAECVLVDKIGCCPCQSGGARWAINKDAGDTLRRFLKRACRESGTCVRLDVCRDDLAPACADHRCVVKVVAPQGETAEGASSTRWKGGGDG